MRPLAADTRNWRAGQAGITQPMSSGHDHCEHLGRVARLVSFSGGIAFETRQEALRSHKSRELICFGKIAQQKLTKSLLATRESEVVGLKHLAPAELWSRHEPGE